jgi:TolB-like protein/Tfp pilus assembly protein PilF
VFAVLIATAAALYFGRDESQVRALVVVPFENSTGNPEDEYLSDGITESLLNSLSQIPGIKVVSRTTAFRYKRKEVDTQQLRRDLGVDAVVTGRVIRQDDNLIVQTELTNTATGSQVWGERFSRKRADIFLLQDEIAKIISQELKLKLSGDDAIRLTKRYTGNPSAYEFYLRGRFHLAKLTPPEVQASVGYFQQAIATDPSYALAYVGLADAYSALALSVDMPANEVYPKAKAAARTALDIDESLAEAHTSLGFAIQFYDWDFRSAQNQYKRALELNPNSSDAHFGYASLFALMAQWDDALAEIERARAFDPLNLRINALEGRFLVLAGRVDEGLAKLQKTIELEPNYFLAHLFAANAYLEKGMYQEAIDEATRAKNLSGGNAEAIAWIAYSLAKWGKRDEARAVLEELKKSSAERYVPPYNFAVIYEGLNESEATLEWLERGVAQRDPKMLFLRSGPQWKKWHKDRRFNSLLERINLSNN